MASGVQCIEPSMYCNQDLAFYHFCGTLCFLTSSNGGAGATHTLQYKPSPIVAVQCA